GSKTVAAERLCGLSPGSGQRSCSPSRRGRVMIMRSEHSLLRSLTLSPHAADPPSWFIRPFLPITFAIVMAGVGSVFVVATLPDFESPAHQSVALLCFVLACLSIHRPAKLRLGPFRWWHSVLPLALSWLGIAVSGLGVVGSEGEISRWWAPLGEEVVFEATDPFISAVAHAGAGHISIVSSAARGEMA